MAAGSQCWRKAQIIFSNSILRSSGSPDEPPAYTVATNDELAPPVDSGAGLILAPGLHPFLGIRRLETKGFLERLQASLDLPDYLIIAKKSLVNTMSVLYMIMLIVTCMVLVTTEVI